MNDRRNAILLWAGIALSSTAVAYVNFRSGHWFFFAVACNTVGLAALMAVVSAFGGGEK